MVVWAGKLPVVGGAVLAADGPLPVVGLAYRLRGKIWAVPPRAIWNTVSPGARGVLEEVQPAPHWHPAPLTASATVVAPGRAAVCPRSFPSQTMTVVRALEPVRGCGWGASMGLAEMGPVALGSRAVNRDERVSGAVAS